MNAKLLFVRIIKMKMLRNIKEAIYTLINDWIFDETEIIALIYESLSAHLPVEEFGETIVQFDTVSDLEQEFLDFIENEERGSTDEGEIMGFTYVDNPDIFRMTFVINPIKRYIAKDNPFQARRKIKEIAKHEAFHARQYNYLIKNGGMDSIERVSDYMKVEHYDTNILEEGASDYQLFDLEQDFKVLDRFIYPDVVAEKKLARQKSGNETSSF